VSDDCLGRFALPPIASNHKEQAVSIATRLAKLSGIKHPIVLAAMIPAAIAVAQQDRFTLQVPDGLAFSEIRGYETWQDVAVSQVQDGLKVIVANDTMINAYREGVPGNGKAFPDGSKTVKIEWSQKNPQFPLFRDGAGHAEIGFVHREGFHEIPEHARMGICPVCL
jgi:hypothetical protein